MHLPLPLGVLHAADSGGDGYGYRLVLLPGSTQTVRLAIASVMQQSVTLGTTPYFLLGPSPTQASRGSGCLFLSRASVPGYGSVPRLGDGVTLCTGIEIRPWGHEYVNPWEMFVHLQFSMFHILHKKKVIVIAADDEARRSQ